jgi:hypothetical protein
MKSWADFSQESPPAPQPLGGHFAYAQDIMNNDETIPKMTSKFFFISIFLQPFMAIQLLFEAFLPPNYPLAVLIGLCPMG